MGKNYQYIKELLVGKFSLWRTIASLFTQLLGVALVATSIYFAYDIESLFRAGAGDENYIILTQEVSPLSDFMGLDSSIPQSTIEELTKSEGVQRIGEFISSKFGVFGGVKIGENGMGISTEMFFEAVDSSFIDIKPLDNWRFDGNRDKFVPVIIPQNYLNLYNFGFSNSMGLPKLSRDIIGNVEFDLELYSRGGNGGTPTHLKGQIVGFSNRINTILAPKEFVEWGNAKYGNSNTAGGSSRLIVELDPLKSQDIISKAKSLGLESENSSNSYSEMGGVVSTILLVVIIVGVMITLLSVAMMVMMLYVLIERNRAKISSLRILGFEWSKISAPYEHLLRYFMISGVTTGWVLATLLRFIYITIIENYMVAADPIRVDWITPSLIILIIWIAIYCTTQWIVKRRIKE